MARYYTQKSRGTPHAIRWLGKEMTRIKELLMEGSSQDIENYFAVAKELRDELPISAGAMYTPFDLYVDVPDYPGVISEVTGFLADEAISITNLRIVESREDVFGILVISFQSENDRERAAACIQKRANFETYISSIRKRRHFGAFYLHIGGKSS